MVNNSFSTNEVEEEQGSGFSIRDFIDTVILHWYWFLISAAVCLLLAFAYLRYQSPFYASWIKVLIKDEDSYKRSKSSALADFSQLGMVNNSNGFDNELEILKSKLLARRAVVNLKLYTSYAYEGRLRDMELYGDTPLFADMVASDLDSLSSSVKLKVSTDKSGGYKIEGETLAGAFETNVKRFPAKVKTPYGWVALVPNPACEMSPERTLIINIVCPSAVAGAYAGGLVIEPVSKTTSIARLSLNGTKTRRAEDYLTELIRVYNEDANETKNEVALKTEAFINKRIQIIDEELGGTESKLESFKKDNRLVDLSAEAASAHSGVESYQEKQIDMQVQMMLIKSLKDYVDNPKNYMELIPSNLGMKDETLNKAIADYNTLVLERNRLLKTAPETSPVVMTATNAIAAIYPGIRQSIAAVYSNLQMQKRSLDTQYNQFVGRLSEAPTQERVLADIGRQQAVKAALYQILLQKREENAISLASTVDLAQIVDLAESSPIPVSPNRKMIMLMALAIGLGLPIGVLYLMNVMRTRIEGRNDIEKLTKIPVLSDIFLSKDLVKLDKRSIVVRENANGVQEESFRKLRVNLGFVMKKSEKVLICTSVLPSEGKTFVSTNLAMSMALLGRKVLVIGMDVRKPRLAKLFGIKSGDNGLTNYLASEDESDTFLRNQIFKSGVHDNLDVLPVGLIPPNPTELIASERLERALDRFREWYDFIILDTAPLGLVSDTLLLGRLADATLVVCRCDFSLKRNFELINALHHENKLPHINLVLNGVDLDHRKYGYYYGSYRYGGRYGYYSSYGRYGSYGVAEDGATSGKSKGKMREDDM